MVYTKYASHQAQGKTDGPSKGSPIDFQGALKIL